MNMAINNDHKDKEDFGHHTWIETVSFDIRCARAGSDPKKFFMPLYGRHF